MKRKFTFFGICVLFCTLMISLGSCQKDYSEDIDKLQTQITANKDAIAALNGAIASGKLIKTVSAVTGGYVITFSDNTTITINHGTNGTNGAPGAPGAPGADGFTPIIGIDAGGYWTVVTSQGGTAVRIKDAGGNEIIAKFSTDLGVDANGMLTVGGVATTVPIPMIVYNSVTKQLTVTVKNENGVLTPVTVAVAEDTFLATDLTSVVSPIGNTKVLIGYGKVGPANVNVETNPGAPFVTTVGSAAEGLTWAGVALDDQLRSGGVMPVILNPASVNTDDFTFEVIKADGSLYKLQPSSITSGYDGAFVQYAAGTSNGLFSLSFTPALADVLAVVGVTNELAVRAVKGDREVVSGYQYSINVAADIETTFDEKVAGNVTPMYVPFANTVDVLSMFDNTFALWPAPAPAPRTLVKGDFFKSELLINPGSVNSDLAGYITINGTDVTAAQPSIETVSNLNDKQLQYTLRTFDWVGKYKKHPVDVVYYAELNTNVADINLGSHTLSTTATFKSAMLTPMFSALQAEGKTELWRSQANNVEIEVYKGSIAPANLVTPFASGISWRFKDAADAQVGAWDTPVTLLADVPAIRKVEFNIVPTVALPGNYIMVLKFDDRRTYAQGVEFTVEMPLTIVNPTIAAIATATDKKANVFDGQKLSVYGTAPSAPVQGSGGNFYYDIFNGYKNLDDINVAPASPAIGVNNWGFVYDATTPLVPSAMLSGTNDGRFDFGSVLAANTTTARPYTEYPVKLYYYYFGNANNKELLETITVEARSEIKDGTSEVLTPAAPLPATLQVTNGDIVTVRNFKPYFMVKDYLGVDLNVFDPAAPAPAPARDVRAATVTVTVPAAQAHLINVTANATNDWDIVATNNVAVLPTAFVDIPVKLTITDLLDVETEYTINVRVVKP